jgi:uncharacterized protein (TIGR03086 family)
MDLASAYRDALETFGGRVHAAGPDDWSNPTPCTEWDVRALVNHVVYENLWVPELLAGRTLAEIGDRFEGDVLGEDPVGAWDASAAAAGTAVSAPGALERTVETSGGPTPAETYLREVWFDAVIHGWDLGRGLGMDPSIDPDAAAVLLPWFEPKAAAWQAAGAIAAPVPLGADASDGERLVALSGRDPRPRP